MTAVTRRHPAPRLAAALAAVSVLGALLCAHLGAPAASAQQVGPSDRVAVLSAYFEAVSRGDLDAAVATFADTGTFIFAGGNMCTPQAPCTDSAGVRARLQSNIASHNCQTLNQVQAAGAVVSGVFEARNDGLRAIGVPRVSESVMALVPQDKITFFVVLLDSADPQTALFTAIGAGTQPVGRHNRARATAPDGEPCLSDARLPAARARNPTGRLSPAR